MRGRVVGFEQLDDVRVLVHWREKLLPYFSLTMPLMKSSPGAIFPLNLFGTCLVCEVKILATLSHQLCSRPFADYICTRCFGFLFVVVRLPLILWAAWLLV